MAEEQTFPVLTDAQIARIAVKGRRRAFQRGDVTEPEPDELLGLVQTDAELSEIFMRAFILRRVTLLERGFGDVIVLGSTFSPRTLQVREFLARNAHPYTYVDLD